VDEHQEFVLLAGQHGFHVPRKRPIQIRANKAETWRIVLL
jgi:hypothetical protein